MKKISNRTIWVFWFPLGLAAILFLLVTFIGNILVIGSKLETFHPAVEWIFYIGLMLISLWVIVTPLIDVLSKPVLSLDDIVSGTNKTGYKTIKKVARQMIDSGILPIEHHNKLAGALRLGSDLRVPLSTAITMQNESARNIIHDHAVLVFISTTISQNGRLDAIAVLGSNLRLVRSLVINLGYRPPLPVLIKIYAQIFLSALIADQIDDFDVEGVLGQFGSGVIASIPGSTLLINSILDGTINALLTLRIGFVTQKFLLNAGGSLSRNEIRKIANREARRELKSVWMDALPVLPSTIKQLVQKFI